MCLEAAGFLITPTLGVPFGLSLLEVQVQALTRCFPSCHPGVSSHNTFPTPDDHPTPPFISHSMLMLHGSARKEGDQVDIATWLNYFTYHPRLLHFDALSSIA